MTTALSDHSLDQIFRSARTPNGWADRPGRNVARDLRPHEMGADICEQQPRAVCLGA